MITLITLIKIHSQKIGQSSNLTNYSYRVLVIAYITSESHATTDLSVIGKSPTRKVELF